MKKTALLILGVLLAGHALAQFDYPGRKLNKLTLEIIENAKQAAKKAPDEAAKIAAFTAYLETRKEEYKEASIEACIAERGVEKAGACSCGAEKSDYPRLFRFWALHNLTEQDTSAELDALTVANDAVAQGCGLTDEQAQ